MRKIFILVLLAGLYVACSEKKPDTLTVFDVDLKQSPKKSFNELYELSEVIPLETTDSSLMGTLAKVVAVGDRLFISNFGGHVLYIFNRQGKYLSKINHKGRGPGEYIKLSDFVVLPDSKEVVIYDMNGKLVYYDWEGNFHKEEKITPYLTHIENLPTGGWLTNHGLMQTPAFQGVHYIIRATDAQGNDLVGLDTLPHMPYSVPISIISVFAQDQGHYHVTPVIENTVYEYNWQDTSFIPRYKFSVADYLLPDMDKLAPEDMLKGFFAKYYMFCRVFVGQKTILLIATRLNSGEMYTLVAEKETGAVHVFSVYPEDKENEIGLNAYMQHSGFDGQVVMSAMPVRIIEREYSNQNSMGYKLSRQLHEEDNPVLFVYKEK